MLFQPTNIVPDLRTGIGLGVFDVNDGMQVSWQVNGDYPKMTAFAIAIYPNDTGSSYLYRTGKLYAGCPFYGRDSNGEVQFFSYTIAPSTLTEHGINNGNEYKMLIRQYYLTNGESGTETDVLTSSAPVFLTRDKPSFTMTTPNVVSAEYTFQWTYSQAQGDTIEWIRYQIQIVGGGNSEIIYDSGSIYGAAVYACTYSGFISGQTYAVRAYGQTSSGVSISTEWEQFTASYGEDDDDDDDEMSGEIAAGCTSGYNAITVSWLISDNIPAGATTWVLYRQQSGKLAMQKVAETPISTTTVYDFGAASDQGPYTYYLFAANATTYLSKALISNEVTHTRYYWSLLRCEENQDGVFRAIAEYDFKLNLDSGSFSNNNSPNVMQNFTAMPTVQLSPSNYKSGTLSALIGKAAMGKYTGDTLELREAIMALSITQDALFLKSSKGDIMMVEINGAITATIADTVQGKPQTVQVPWVEIDDTPVSIIAYDNDPIFTAN